MEKHMGIDQDYEDNGGLLQFYHTWEGELFVSNEWIDVYEWVAILKYEHLNGMINFSALMVNPMIFT